MTYRYGVTYSFALKLNPEDSRQKRQLLAPQHLYEHLNRTGVSITNCKLPFHFYFGLLISNGYPAKIL
jgi:hypothetical protein